eukprot:m.59990 g.59990  ORF g.59990 m.59990 type:complete len:921 (-) comp11789_c0_seq4:378-3140(-)
MATIHSAVPAGMSTYHEHYIVPVVPEHRKKKLVDPGTRKQRYVPSTEPKRRHIAQTLPSTPTVQSRKTTVTPKRDYERPWANPRPAPRETRPKKENGWKPPTSRAQLEQNNTRVREAPAVPQVTYQRPSPRPIRDRAPSTATLTPATPQIRSEASTPSGRRGRRVLRAAPTSPEEAEIVQYSAMGRRTSTHDPKPLPSKKEKKSKGPSVFERLSQPRLFAKSFRSKRNAKKQEEEEEAKSKRAAKKDKTGFTPPVTFGVEEEPFTPPPRSVPSEAWGTPRISIQPAADELDGEFDTDEPPYQEFLAVPTQSIPVEAAQPEVPVESAKPEKKKKKPKSNASVFDRLTNPKFFPKLYRRRQADATYRKKRMEEHEPVPTDFRVGPSQGIPDLPDSGSIHKKAKQRLVKEKHTKQQRQQEVNQLEQRALDGDLSPIAAPDFESAFTPVGLATPSEQIPQQLYHDEQQEESMSGTQGVVSKKVQVQSSTTFDDTPTPVVVSEPKPIRGGGRKLPQVDATIAATAVGRSASPINANRARFEERMYLEQERKMKRQASASKGVIEEDMANFSTPRQADAEQAAIDARAEVARALGDSYGASPLPHMQRTPSVEATEHYDRDKAITPPSLSAQQLPEQTATTTTATTAAATSGAAPSAGSRRVLVKSASMSSQEPPTRPPLDRSATINEQNASSDKVSDLLAKARKRREERLAREEREAQKVLSGSTSPASRKADSAPVTTAPTLQPASSVAQPPGIPESDSGVVGSAAPPTVPTSDGQASPQPAANATDPASQERVAQLLADAKRRRQQRLADTSASPTQHITQSWSMLHGESATVLVTLTRPIEGGLGMVLGSVPSSTTDFHVTVKAIKPDSPAHNGGLVAGDRLIKCNGVSCKELDVTSVTGIIKQVQPGQSLNLLVLREVSTA